MKISIITTTYNSGLTVRDTIESVLTQTYPDIEYIIVDGVSSDRTLEVARSYEPKFGGRMRIVSEPDRGIYDALNKGIALATGEVIGFIHADDRLASGEVIDHVAQQFSDTRCDMLYGDLYYVDSTDSKIIRSWKSKPFAKKLLRRGWMPAHPTLYVRKSIYDTVGVFDPSFRIAADYDFILRAFLRSDPQKIVYLPLVMVRMRVGGVSNAGVKNIILKMKEDLRALHRNQVGGLCTLVQKNISKIKQLLIK